MGGHYIEVEVWSTEEKKDPLPVPYQLRDVLTIPTYSYTAQGRPITSRSQTCWTPRIRMSLTLQKRVKTRGKWGRLPLLDGS